MAPRKNPEYNVLPDYGDAQLIILTESDSTGWSPAAIREPGAIEFGVFEAGIISQLDSYKRKAVFDVFDALNGKQKRGAHIWVAIGLEFCEDGSICLVAKAVQPSQLCNGYILLP
ncbi:hypothetical protein AA313_de0204891 [Arthrobotrys entomopaga]|nr:hypothetical protein AA313_de0204891 [Arthrobotrys entomopaga]